MGNAIKYSQDWLQGLLWGGYYMTTVIIDFKDKKVLADKQTTQMFYKGSSKHLNDKLSCRMD